MICCLKAKVYEMCFAYLAGKRNARLPLHIERGGRQQTFKPISSRLETRQQSRLAASAGITTGKPGKERIFKIFSCDGPSNAVLSRETVASQACCNCRPDPIILRADSQEFKNVESSLGIETAKQPSYPPLVTKVGQFPVWATLGVVLAFSIAIPVGGQPGPRCENL